MMRSGLTMPATDSPYLGSRSFTVWPPGDDDTRLLRNVHAAEQHASEHVLRQILREADDVQRKERRPAHGVDVAESVHRCDGPEVVRDRRR